MQKQTGDAAPERRGLWAFIFPYFEPFLVGSTDAEGNVNPPPPDEAKVAPLEAALDAARRAADEAERKLNFGIGLSHREYELLRDENKLAQEAYALVQEAYQKLWTGNRRPRPSRYELMKGRSSPSVKLKKARYTGMLYTRLQAPGKEVDGWMYTDADTLRKYVFSRFRVDEYAGWAREHRKENEGDPKFRPLTRIQMPRTSKDHFEVFIPANQGRFSPYGEGDRGYEEDGE